MKKTILSLVFFLLVSAAFAQNYLPVDDGSTVKFAIRNFGLTVNGSFKGLKGKVSFDPTSPATAFINAAVDVATINTGNGTRDAHLKKQEYFDVIKYPRISFISTKIVSSTSAGTYLVEGNITIKGVTKKIAFPFTAVSKGDGYLLEGTFKINRRDFAVGDKSMVLSDNLTVTLSVFARKN
jgi:polyisoprenoid-binding protein YceI